MMIYLEIDDNNVVRAYFHEEKANIIVTAYHCFKNYSFPKVKFKNSKSHKIYKLLK